MKSTLVYVAEALLDDPRVRRYWDADRVSGVAYSRDLFPIYLADMGAPPAAFSKQVLFYGKNEDGKSGTFWRDDFASAPLESDWYVEVRTQLTRLMGSEGRAA